MSNLDFLSMVMREAGYRSRPTWKDRQRFLGMRVSSSEYTKIISDVNFASARHGLDGIRKMKEIMKGLHIERGELHGYDSRTMVIFWDTVPCLDELQEA